MMAGFCQNMQNDSGHTLPVLERAVLNYQLLLLNTTTIGEFLSENYFTLKVIIFVPSQLLSTWCFSPLYLLFSQNKLVCDLCHPEFF